MADAKKSSDGRSLGLASTVAIGIGGMVGGGIFSVLGLTVQVAGSGAYVSFALSGLAVMLTGYSYAKLSVRYPSSGGTVEFINRAYSKPLLAGSLNVLLWLGYLVMLALYAYAFGAYLAEVFGQPAGGVWSHIATSVVVVAFTVLNFLAAAIVGRVESVLVYVKVAVLVFFVVTGLFFVDFDRVAPAGFPGLGSILFGGALIYLAYEGFELIANAAEDVDDPSRTLPLAYYICIGSVTVIYILVTFVAVGNLSTGAIVEQRDYALAAAAQPFLGRAGFVLIGVTAAISTASALNATLYGTAKFTYVIARSGELPSEFMRRVWNKPAIGLLVTAAGTLLVANTVDIEGISLMGSGVFLILFAAVNLANVLLADETGASRLVSSAATATCVASFGALIVYAATTIPMQLLILVGLIVGSFLIEAASVVIRRRRGTVGT